MRQNTAQQACLQQLWDLSFQRVARALADHALGHLQGQQAGGCRGGGEAAGCEGGI